MEGREVSGCADGCVYGVGEEGDAEFGVVDGGAKNAIETWMLKERM